MNKIKNVAIGVDIGGTNTKLGLITESGEVLAQEKFETHGPVDFKAFCAELISKIKSWQKKFSSHHFLGIGLGAPDLDPKSGMIVNPPNLKWGTSPLKKELESLTDLSLVLENDANIAAVGEKIFGQAKNLENFLVITLGTGVGTGIFVNNKLIPHTEGGHAVIIPGGRECACGGLGHLEAYANIRGIELTAEKFFTETLSLRQIIELYLQGDERAVKVFDQTAEYLALGLASFNNLILFEAIYLTGGISHAGDRFVAKIQQELEARLFINHRNKTQISLSKIGGGSGQILGAAGLIFLLHKKS